MPRLRQDNVYRFLLRMPHGLRERLSAVVGAKGTSLNREIVERLEASFDANSNRASMKGRGAVMKRKFARPAVAAGLVVAVAVLAGVTLHVQKTTIQPLKSAKLSLDPDKLTKHGLPAVKRTPLGDPTLAAVQELSALAYPASSVSSKQQKAARDFFTGTIAARGKSSGNSWQLAGPSTATVDSFLNRTSADYVTSGRITAEAIAPTCVSGNCKMWIAAAGGGIWRTDDALAGNPSWAFVSGAFGTNAIGALTYDARTNTLYAGTGEPNASGDSESGVGIYKSTDGGSNWALLPGSPAAMNARSISSIVIDPSNANTIYVGTTRGVRGVSSVTGGAVSLAPDAPPWGLYRTTDGGNSFSEVWDGNGSARGVNHVEIDSHGVVYAAAFQQGIWRSANGSTGWEQVFATQDPGNNAARTEFALTTVDGATRIYVGDGGEEDQSQVVDDSLGFVSNTSVYRADGIDTADAADLAGTDGSDPGYTPLTSSDPTDPQFATYDYCEGQCWYDNFVVSPAGHPDVVYVGGSYDYGRQPYAVNNGNAVLVSDDAGATWNDQTADAGRVNGIHPDQHALVVNPSNPMQFFEGSDGGVIRSSGATTDDSSNCPNYGSPYNEECANVTTAVPTHLDSLNVNLSTLQFQSVSINPTDSTDLIAGTQDNGTWAGKSGTPNWSQAIWGDGGQAGFDSGNHNVRFINFYSPYSDVNFRNGEKTSWVFVGDPWIDANGVPQENSAFYLPEIADPNTAGQLFIGLQHVWRTTDDGGDQRYLESHCREQDVYVYDKTCGDWKPLGDPSATGSTGVFTQPAPTYTAGDLTAPGVYGTDRAGGYVVATRRSSSDKSTLWAATATGRVFISTNVNAPDAGAVTFTRLDSLSKDAPGRFVSGIVVDPNNSDHAWISYTGYNANTPDQPGHVFEVTYDPKHNRASWDDIDRGTGPLGDVPVTGIARDDESGQMYASTDFGVLTTTDGKSGKWQLAASGMPMVEVAGITIDSAHRVMYAATHGRAIWTLQLPDAKGKGNGKH
jgi:hypothetical protein